METTINAQDYRDQIPENPTPKDYITVLKHLAAALSSKLEFRDDFFGLPPERGYRPTPTALWLAGVKVHTKDGSTSDALAVKLHLLEACQTLFDLVLTQGVKLVVGSKSFEVVGEPADKPSPSEPKRTFTDGPSAYPYITPSQAKSRFNFG